jgi:hypothetical protein
MNTLEKCARYASLARQTVRTIGLLEACGMTEQADRHRECAALLCALVIRFGGTA